MTAADLDTAFATLPDLDRPDAGGGATVRLEGDDVVLEGHGDARLSGAVARPAVRRAFNRTGGAILVGAGVATAAMRRA